MTQTWRLLATCPGKLDQVTDSFRRKPQDKGSRICCNTAPLGAHRLSEQFSALTSLEVQWTRRPTYAQTKRTIGLRLWPGAQHQETRQKWTTSQCLLGPGSLKKGPCEPRVWEKETALSSLWSWGHKWLKEKKEYTRKTEDTRPLRVGLKQINATSVLGGKGKQLLPNHGEPRSSLEIKSCPWWGTESGWDGCFVEKCVFPHFSWLLVFLTHTLESCRVPQKNVRV